MKTFKQQCVEVLEEMMREYNNIGMLDYELPYIVGKNKINNIPEDNGWINVEERFPNSFQLVLVIAYGIIEICEYDEYEKGWIRNDEIADDEVITHWMPLPSPPTSNDNQIEYDL